MDINQTNPIMTEYSEQYLARCTQELKDRGAPLKNWTCVFIYDIREDNSSLELTSCELCKCSRVRFVHRMHHPEHPTTLDVGCICAGIMEDDILAAKERERMMRNRANRRGTFMRKNWRYTDDETWFRRYRRVEIEAIKQGNGNFVVNCDSRRVTQYKGKPLSNFRTAKLAAFDYIDRLKHPELEGILQ